MRENPLNLPVPEDMIDRVHAFIRDLAYGVVQEYWESGFMFMGNPIRIYVMKLTEKPENHKLYSKLYNDKWSEKFPDLKIIETFQYLTYTNSSNFSLTMKAFQLLEKPATPPTIFISYKRGISTNFALYLEARLKLAGNPNPYLDKSLKLGSKWEEQLKEQIEASKNFIILVNSETKDSDPVKKELQWAKDSKCRILPIFHDMKDMKINSCGLDGLDAIHAIEVKGETANDYEAAANNLLNSLGYSTY